MIFIFVYKFFKKTELSDKINFIEHNRVTTGRTIMLALDLQKNLQVSKSTGNSGVMM